MKSYTVVLRLPDYATDNFGECATVQVKGRKLSDVIQYAQIEVCRTILGIEAASQYADFAVVALFEGAHENILSQAERLGFL